MVLKHLKLLILICSFNNQIEYGEASLTCIVRDKQIAFAGVSRTKKVMFDKSHKE